MRKIRRVVYDYITSSGLHRPRTIYHGIIGGREAAILFSEDKYVLFFDSRYYEYDVNLYHFQELFNISMDYLEYGYIPDYDDPGFE